MDFYEKKSNNSNNYSQSFDLNSKVATHNRKVWAIAGGKGGVGKSLITANISICLSLMGYKTVAIDLDLGGANLHTCLGVTIPNNTLSDFLTKKVLSINDILTKTPINSNLFLISGAQDDLEMANLKHIQQRKILSQLMSLDAEFILFDLGAGTAQNTLDFFISSGTQILAVLPEPTSIENTYRFIKTAFYRKLQLMENTIEFRPIINNILNSKISEQCAPIELIKKITEVNPDLGDIVNKEIANFRPKIIMNQVRTQSDIDIGFSMKTVCKRYFGIDLDYIGYLDYDTTAWQSVKRRKPLLMEFPNSPLAPNFDKMVHRLLKEI